MDFEGKTCGICNKGKMHSIRDEITKGSYVEALKCDYCKAVSFTAENMKKIESMDGA